MHAIIISGNNVSVSKGWRWQWWWIGMMVMDRGHGGESRGLEINMVVNQPSGETKVGHTLPFLHYHPLLVIIIINK